MMTLPVAVLASLQYWHQCTRNAVVHAPVFEYNFCSCQKLVSPVFSHSTVVGTSLELKIRVGALHVAKSSLTFDSVKHILW